MALLKSFGRDYDISTQLNQLIDEENISVRRQNHNIVRALRKLKIVTEESDIEFDKSDGDDEKENDQEEEEKEESRNNGSTNVLSSGV